MSTPARRRLMRDFRRLQNDPPSGVTGAPMDNNILAWQVGAACIWWFRCYSPIILCVSLGVFDRNGFIFLLRSCYCLYDTKYLYTAVVLFLPHASVRYSVQQYTPQQSLYTRIPTNYGTTSFSECSLYLIRMLNIDILSCRCHTSEVRCDSAELHRTHGGLP